MHAYPSAMAPRAVCPLSPAHLQPRNWALHHPKPRCLRKYTGTHSRITAQTITLTRSHQLQLPLWHMRPYISGARVMAACARKLSVYVRRILRRPEVRVTSALILAISGNGRLASSPGHTHFSAWIIEKVGVAWGRQATKDRNESLVMVVKDFMARPIYSTRTV